MRTTKPNTNNSKINDIRARFAIYTLIIFGLTCSLPIISKHNDIAVFHENGPIEWLQFILLVISIATLLYSSMARVRDSQELFFIFMLLATIAAIREVDSALNKLKPSQIWEWLVSLCIITGIVVYWRKKDAFTAQIAAFARTHAFSLLWCGFIVAVPFAQLVGREAFLQLLMGDDYIRSYKRVIEELGELMGYLLILIGSIEAVLQQNGGNASVAKSMTREAETPV